MQINDVVSAIIVGLVIGVLGRLILPGRQHIGVFVTFVIGVGSALLGSVVARVVGVANRAPVSLSGQSWVHWHWLANVRWDWIVLAIQLGFAVVGTAIAAAISHTRVAYQDPLNRENVKRRRRRPRSLT
jgi:uncharacterized membrane protein YeaQ/YmgE (transglycosylase-associated protein family)